MNQDLDQAVKDIMNCYIEQRLVITKQILLQSIAYNHEAYSKGSITYQNMKLLDNAIKHIWENQFNSKIDLITNIY